MKLKIYNVSNSMEQDSSREANSRSASQEISLSLWNPMIFYRVDKNPLLVPDFSQINPVQSLTLFP
jgi:hypothetical protein